MLQAASPNIANAHTRNDESPHCWKKPHTPRQPKAIMNGVGASPSQFGARSLRRLAAGMAQLMHCSVIERRPRQ